jgi:hypothetical protein
LYTGCDKIKKKFRLQKVNNLLVKLKKKCFGYVGNLVVHAVRVERMNEMQAGGKEKTAEDNARKREKVRKRVKM